MIRARTILITALLCLAAAACGSTTSDQSATLPNTGPTTSEPSSGTAIEIAAQVTVDGVALTPYDAETTDVSLGAAAPTFATTGPDGSVVAYNPGQPTILAFLVHWCPHCQAELPVLSQLVATGATAGIDVVAVSTAFDAERGNWPPSAWFEAESWPADIAVDSAESAIASAFGMTSFPYLVAIDADGVVVGRQVGGGDVQVAELVALATGAGAGSAT